MPGQVPKRVEVAWGGWSKGMRLQCDDLCPPVDSSLPEDPGITAGIEPLQAQKLARKGPRVTLGEPSEILKSS